MERTKDKYRFSRFLYIIQAAVEYFITTLVGGAYLAKVTATVGMSDDVTAILSSLVTLGVGFQLVALFIPQGKRVKGWVTPCMLIYQLIFTFVYVIPLFSFTREVKMLIMFAALLAGQILRNVIYSPQTGWLMGLVAEHKRGSFTAVKEIVSLLSGMVYTFVIGLVMDHFESQGNINGAFIACSMILLSLTVAHTLLIVFTREKPPVAPPTEKASIRRQVGEAVTDKNLWRVLPVSILWAVATNVSTPFYGTYQNKELGFTMTFIAVIAAVSSLARVFASIPLGRYADRHSFTKMLKICFFIAAAAFLVNTFTVPENGRVMFFIYSVLYAVSMAGINSSAINLIYDATPVERRASALAIRGTVTGFLGFFATLAARPLIRHVQASGNVLFGVQVYAQQVVSAIAFLLLIVTIVYLNTALKRFKRVKANVTEDED